MISRIKITKSMYPLREYIFHLLVNLMCKSPFKEVDHTYVSPKVTRKWHFNLLLLSVFI